MRFKNKNNIWGVVIGQPVMKYWNGMDLTEYHTSQTGQFIGAINDTNNSLAAKSVYKDYANKVKGSRILLFYGCIESKKYSEWMCKSNKFWSYHAKKYTGEVEYIK